ncbi:acyltransferase [filamentous cyanobacterium LEGE 11480]|uniref:Acyltransferase n=1 Tax=Romeriopsis navalis LEGE 11480 TaxID=2777977 RepID=A0A928Z527_9CYAN|nr:acyltransferase [Romeriopsis navalis]MBE9031023.1 acyltransferase [Romeriopsis navalis LEGE 11480]
MKVTNLLFYFLVIFACLLFCRSLVHRSTFIQAAVAKSAALKHTTLDGLRGLLAINVVIHHAVFTYFYFEQDGIWKMPVASHFYFSIGSEAVTLFFMMTAFLAWSGVIKRPKIDIPSFYLKRAIRIFPLYWISVIGVIIVVLVTTNFSLESPSLMHAMRTLDDWFTAQITNLPFIFGRQLMPNINEFPAWMVNAGVSWTLAYDLNFYLLLPLLANFVRLDLFVGLAICLAAVHRYFDVEQTGIMIRFLCGMSLAYIFPRARLDNYLKHPIASIGIIMALGLGWVIPIPPSLQLACMLFAFTGILYGNSLFGLLTLKATRYLGIISYGVYLLHGIVLFITFHSLNRWIPVKTLSPISFWSITGLCAIVAVILASLTYRYVEYPIIQRRLFSGSLPRQIPATE